MASTQNYRNGRLVAQWTNAVQPGDPTPAGYTAWDDTGAVATQRALTAAEVAQLAADDAGQTESSNATTLQANAQAALTTNVAFLGTVVARRTAIANGKSTAQTGTTATVANVAAAQTQIRSVWSTLVQIATALDDLNNDAESVTKQNNAIIRLLLGALDTTAGT